jgi:DnaJ-domain-containing protein 1
MNDFLTTVLSQDPRAIKFLAKIGDQFAENKVGEFQMKRFTVSPDEAREEAMKMSRDLNGPYMNQANKFNDREHQAAIERYNSLVRVSMKRG